jgi:hypothetical protein
MNHAEETKELLFNDQGLNETQQPKAEPQLRRDGKLGSKRPLIHEYVPGMVLAAGV